MKTLQLALTAALLAGSTWAVAAQAAGDTTREQRMDSALQNYRSKQANKRGPAARAEASMKRGARKAGNAIERGASATGHAVKRGAHKTGEAADRVGDKIKGSTGTQP